MSKKTRKKKLRKLRKTILYLISIPLVLMMLIRVSNPIDTASDFTSSTVGAANTRTEDTEEEPVAEVVWEYPEGYVDLSDLPMVDTSTWEFTLVNSLSKENYVRDTFVPQLAEVEGFKVRIGVDGPLTEMLTACREAGHEIYISKAYMSYYEISYRFNGVASGQADGQGMSYEDAVKVAKRIAHYPGTDEHQLGVAVNFVDGEGGTGVTSPAIKWITQNCHKYGFILRYPAEKEDQTGWNYTSNQFRYVGREAAGYIMDKGLCLEEFLTAVRDVKARDY